MNKEQVLGIVRHTLTFVGGLWVMKGVIEESMSNEIVGGLMTAIGGIWSIIDKVKK
jgi:hypothetical protein